jgi:vesicle-associated membrane protein 7
MTFKGIPEVRLQANYAVTQQVASEFLSALGFKPWSAGLLPSLRAMSIIYSVVARGTTVLAEQTSASTSATNAPQVASLILDKIAPEDASKLTYVYGDHLVHYITTPSTSTVPAGVTYLCISTDTGGRRVPFLLLTSIQSAFTEQFSEDDVASAPPYGLNSFAKTLKAQMEWADGGAKGSGVDKGKEVREEMNAVKDVMVQNIERVLERGERIDLLVNKTDHMNQTAFAFRQRSTALRSPIKGRWLM